MLTGTYSYVGFISFWLVGINSLAGGSVGNADLWLSFSSKHFNNLISL